MIDALTPDNETQLQLIKELLSLAESAQLPCWLFGGWGADFAIGESTREHVDIDFVVWKDDVARLRQLLVSRDYWPIEITAEEAEYGMAYVKEGQLMEFCFIERNEQDQIITPGRWKNWPWPAESFTASPGELNGIVAPIISAERQLYIKKTAEQRDRPLETPEMEDIRRLELLLDRENHTSE